MGRWLYRLTLGLLLLTSPAWAQRGGGGHGGGFGGGHGFSGGGARGFSGGGARGYSGGGYVARGGGYAYRGYAGGYVYRGRAAYGRYPSYYVAHPGSSWNGGRGWNYGRNGYGWRNGWRGPWRGGYYPYGYGYGYPFWGGAYIGWGYPFWGWDSDFGWDDSSYDTSSQPAYTAPSYPSYVYVTPGSDDYAQLSQQQQDEINRLNSEVASLRAQQASSSQPPSDEAQIHAETVLVYRDGHSREVQNYAIVGKTLWVFDESRATKIPLSELNLPATQRDNQDRGIDFVVPNSSR